jgi:gliding motility-associated-like protein
MSKILITLGLTLISLVGISQCSGFVSFDFNPQYLPNSIYPPNTEVVFCCTMTGWDGGNQGSNWFEGFSLTLGSGWANVLPLQAPNDADDESGDWIWVTNVTSESTGFTAGPGYFFEGPTGPIDGNPGNDWGDLCIDGDCIWEFCVTLTTSNIAGESLSIGVTPYADGTMGSWGNWECFDGPTIWNGTIGCGAYGCIDPLACNFNPNANCDNGSCEYFSIGSITPCPDTVCTGLETFHSVTGNQTSLYDWSTTGGLITTDQTNDCSIIWGNIPGTYTISVHEINPQGCESEDVICDVVVVAPDIIFDPISYSICLNSSVQLKAQPLGGIWISEFVNGDVFIGTELGTYQPSYQTNIYGCDVQEEVEVEVRDKYEAPNILYTTNVIDFCLDPYIYLYQAEDSYGVTYSWFIDEVLQPTTNNNVLVEWHDTTQTHLIKVIAYDEIGCESESKQITIKTEACQRFFAPNSFTPNGDGLNDVFKISGLSIYQPTLRIFNRWGVEVYTSSNLYWTGDSGSGYFCDDGVYSWIISYKDKFGQNRQESGHVILIR